MNAGPFETVSGDRAGAIVVREGVVGPRSLRQEPLPFLDDRAEALGDPRLLEEVEVERELQLVVVAVVAHVPSEVPHADLADRHAVTAVRVEDLPPSAVDLVNLVEIPVASPRPAADLEARIVP